MDTKIVKPSEANIFLEGVEVCREYFHTEKITFGTSELQPGQTGAVDNGHKDSHGTGSKIQEGKEISWKRKNSNPMSLRTR